MRVLLEYLLGSNYTKNFVFFQRGKTGTLHQSSPGIKFTQFKYPHHLHQEFTFPAFVKTTMSVTIKITLKRPPTAVVTWADVIFP